MFAQGLGFAMSNFFFCYTQVYLVQSMLKGSEMLYT